MQILKYLILLKIHIKFNIVGEGPSYVKVSDLSSLNSEFFSLNMIGRLEGEYMRNFLAKQDIMIAMGTCALIGAMHGLPVIRLDILNKPVSSFSSYQMLYEGKDFTLGNNITSSTKQEGRSLSDIMDKIRNSYIEESVKTKEYVFNNFDLSSIAQELLGYIKKTTFTYRDFFELKLNKRGLTYHCLSWYKVKFALLFSKKND